MATYNNYEKILETGVPVYDDPHVDPWYIGIRKHRWHICCFLLSLLVWGGVTGAFLTYRETENNDSWEGLTALSVMAYIIYLIESFTSPSFKYLWHSGSTQKALDSLNALRNTPPELNCTIQCYRMQTVTSESRVTNNKGREEVRYDTRTERINTVRASESLKYQTWRDLSADIYDIVRPFQHIRLNITAEAVFGNTEAETAYNAMVAKLRRRMEARGEQMEVTETVRIDRMVPHMLLLPLDTNSAYGWLDWKLYALSTILVLSWPYRMLMELKTEEVSYVLKKAVFVDTNQANAVEGSVYPVSTAIAVPVWQEEEPPPTASWRESYVV